MEFSNAIRRGTKMVFHGYSGVPGTDLSMDQYIHICTDDFDKYDDNNRFGSACGVRAGWWSATSYRDGFDMPKKKDIVERLDCPVCHARAYHGGM